MRNVLFLGRQGGPRPWPTAVRGCGPARGRSASRAGSTPRSRCSNSSAALRPARRRHSSRAGSVRTAADQGVAEGVDLSTGHQVQPRANEALRGGQLQLRAFDVPFLLANFGATRDALARAMCQSGINSATVGSSQGRITRPSLTGSPNSRRNCSSTVYKLARES